MEFKCFKLCYDGLVGGLTAQQVQEVEKFITETPYVVLATNGNETGVRLSGFSNLPGQTAGVLYFVTTLSSQKVKNITENPVCELLYTDNNRQLILNGKVEFVTNKEIRKLKWQPYMIAFFKNQTEDPEYCVIRFTTAQVRAML